MDRNLIPLTTSARPDAAVAAFGVGKRYGGVTALSGIDLTVMPGELVYVTGESGAGKSTLLGVIRGDVPADAGTLRVNGRCLDAGHRAGRDRRRLAREVALVYQDYRLLPGLTALENVVFALQAADPALRWAVVRERAAHWIESVGLKGRLDSFPRELSGGQQQRLAVARALAVDPVLLLADEPTGNLDADNAAAVFELLEAVAAGGTAVIVATHDLQVVTRSRRRAIQLSGGEVVAEVSRSGPRSRWVAR